MSGNRLHYLACVESIAVSFVSCKRYFHSFVKCDSSFLQHSQNSLADPRSTNVMMNGR